MGPRGLVRAGVPAASLEPQRGGEDPFVAVARQDASELPVRLKEIHEIRCAGPVLVVDLGQHE
jgi:hypothetical protein